VLLSVGVVAGIFLGVLPRVADMGEVWSHVRAMSSLEIASLVAATVWNVVTYFFVILAAAPVLSFLQGVVVTMSSTAIANTLPGGGALGVAVTTAMMRSWGATPGDITRYVVVTGVWSNFIKLGMPVVALGALALTGGASTGLVLAAVIGVIVLAVAVVGLVLALRSEAFARRVGRIIGGAASAVRRLVRKPPVTDLDERTATFREETADLLARRWLALTLTSIVSHVSLYVVLLVALRHVGVTADDVTWAEVLAAFAFVRLISALPITPGGLGVVELGYAGALTAFGGGREPVLAAVLVFRALTYLLPVPFGAATYIVWRRASGWRMDEVNPRGRMEKAD